MTGDIAIEILQNLQRLHKNLNDNKKAKHGQVELNFNMYEYDPKDTSDVEVASGEAVSKGSF